MNKFSDAEAAVRDLVDNGFKRDSISMVANKEYEGGYLESEGKQRAQSAGLAIGLTDATIPGIGPVIAGGPLASMFTGGGGIIGALTRLGVPDEHAHYYAEGVRRGGTLLTVESDDAFADKAADIIGRHEAVDIVQRAGQWKKTGWSRFDERAAAYTPEQRKREAVLPVVEEQVKVGKREVGKGGVRVHSYVIERPVEEKVSLREEHAKVERRPVERALKPGEEAFKETTIEIEERAEEPVVSKEARVKEEVVVGKEATERTEIIRETARRTDIDVDEDVDFQSHYKSNYASLGGDYESYKPGYGYARTMSRDKRYMNKEWPQIEGDVRKDWEKENPGTWERFKGAIRYGWDRMRGRPVKKAA
jgi:uncharacterized protein (TIGR02271 family)